MRVCVLEFECVKRRQKDGVHDDRVIAFVIEFGDGVLTNRKELINRAGDGALHLY